MLVYQRVIVIEWDLVGFNGDWMVIEWDFMLI